MLAPLFQSLPLLPVPSSFQRHRLALGDELRGKIRRKPGCFNHFAFLGAMKTAQYILMVQCLNPGVHEAVIVDSQLP